MSFYATHSNDKFRSLFETMEQGVVYQSADGSIIEANPAAERILGLSRDQIMGLTSLDPHWKYIREDGSDFPDDAHPAMIAIRTGRPVLNNVMGVYHLEEGKYRWIMVSSKPDLAEDGSLMQVITTFTDISDHKLAEENLKSNEARFRTLFETMQEGFAMHEVVFDEAGNPYDYRFININQAFERLTGLERTAVVGRSVREVLPQIEEDWIKTCCRVAMTGEPAELESYTHDLDRYFRARVFSPEQGKFVAVFEDVTEQKKALQELSKREELMRVLFESSRAGILMVAPTGAITLANDRMAEMLGYRMEELLRTVYPDHVHPDQRKTGDDRMRKLITGEIDHVSTERHFIRKDGSDFWGYLSGRRHVDAEGTFISLVGHITDITELKQSQNVLMASEQRFRMLVENSIDIIFVVDSNGLFHFISPAWEKHLGYPVNEVIGQTFTPFVHPDDARLCFEYLANVLASGKAATSPIYRVKHNDGSWRSFIANGTRYLDASGTPLFLGISRDITEQVRAEEERLQLEQQLLHAQKLESLGVLAGGIAHDFNNILMAIIGNADLALMRLNRESPAVENLHRIEKAAAQAADLAKQMLAYSGKGKFVVESLDLNRLLEEMLHMLEVSISKNAILRFNLHQSLPPVEVDATQIRQIIMNLVINASEAIGDQSGVIAITTGCMDCDRSYLKDVWLDENLTDGLYVYLEVADSGCGMNRGTMEKIFDPFFTTKFTGRGLGMAAVLGIVRGHKGAIKVYSEVGKGTSFKVLLPASSRPADLFNHTGHFENWTGSGTVLLVDDEETVRGIGKEMLQELGFTVITANDGREGINIFKSTPEITFVILDLTMPHMDGEQCFRELRMLSPDVRVIMTSGYNEQEVTQKFSGKGLAGFIQKPYKLSTLQKVIRSIDANKSAD